MQGQLAVVGLPVAGVEVDDVAVDEDLLLGDGLGVLGAEELNAVL